MANESSLLYRDATTLTGPRTYFTLLDENNLKTVQDKRKYYDDLEGTLKVLLLTKNNIVIAASHLTSDEALTFFRDKEMLFSDKIILPALRSEFATFREMYYSRFPDGKREIPEFFGNVISEVIPWKLEDNSGWFRDRIREEATNSNSVLRKNLQRLGGERPFLKVLDNQLSHSESTGNYFSRERLTKDIESSFPHQTAIALNQWVDLLYYISGARVVNCENYLPQENFVNYNLATLGTEKHILTEKEIFHSILMAVVLANIYNQAYPVDIIRNLSIRDIVDFRSKNQKQGDLFRAKYDECLAVCEKFRNASEKEELLLSLEKLLDLADEIKMSFSGRMEAELGSFSRLVRSKVWTEKAFELIVNFIGIFYLPVSVVNFMFNNCEAKEVSTIEKYRRSATGYYQRMLRRYVAREYQNDPALLDYIDQIIAMHKSKYLIRQV
jgi:hypothetical protein